VPRGALSRPQRGELAGQGALLVPCARRSRWHEGGDRQSLSHKLGRAHRLRHLQGVCRTPLQLDANRLPPRAKQITHITDVVQEVICTRHLRDRLTLYRYRAESHDVTDEVGLQSAEGVS